MSIFVGVYHIITARTVLVDCESKRPHQTAAAPSKRSRQHAKHQLKQNWQRQTHLLRVCMCEPWEERRGENREQYKIYKIKYKPWQVFAQFPNGHWLPHNGAVFGNHCRESVKVFEFIIIYYCHSSLAHSNQPEDSFPAQRASASRSVCCLTKWRGADWKKATVFYDLIKISVQLKLKFLSFFSSCFFGYFLFGYFQYFLIPLIRSKSKKSSNSAHPNSTPIFCGDFRLDMFWVSKKEEFNFDGGFRIWKFAGKFRGEFFAFRLNQNVEMGNVGKWDFGKSEQNMIEFRRGEASNIGLDLDYVELGSISAWS